MPLSRDLREFVECLNSNRVEYLIDGLPVVFIDRDALLRNKEATGRGKDKIDAAELRKQEREKT